MKDKFGLTSEQRKNLDKLIEHGKKTLESPREYHQFAYIKEADDLYHNIEKYGHLFVLGCVMNRQIKAERAWKIPYLIMKDLGGFEFEKLLSLSLGELKKTFSKNKFHRFNDIMAKNFYSAIKKIKEDYNGDASNIWKGDNVSSASVIRKFLEFEGVGQKIASMAVNILVRQFKISLKNLSAIDISTDTHVMRMMKKLGFAPEDASREYIIFRAREFYPEYPGILDIGLFQMGREERRNLSKRMA